MFNTATQMLSRKDLKDLETFPKPSLNPPKTFLEPSQAEIIKSSVTRCDLPDSSYHQTPGCSHKPSCGVSSRRPQPFCH